MKLAITVVSHRVQLPLFGHCLSNLLGHIWAVGKDYGIESYAMNSEKDASCLSIGRQNALDRAIAMGYTHILWLDDDMSFPADTLQRLVSANKPVIGVNYIEKKQNILHFTALDLKGNKIDSRNRKGIEEVAGLGMGIMLMDLAHIKHIPQPHFEVIWDYQKKSYTGEDMYYAWKLRDFGIQLFVDHDLSKQVGHIGDYVYNMETWGEELIPNS